MEKFNGTELIAQERREQIEKHGYDTANDVVHYGNGQLLDAAYAYMLAGNGNDKKAYAFWPWNEKYWKPKDRISNLKRAGALIAAEIDRLQALEG